MAFVSIQATKLAANALGIEELKIAVRDTVPISPDTTVTAFEQVELAKWVAAGGSDVCALAEFLARRVATVAQRSKKW